MSGERRRLVTLAELLAVASVLIAALTLWNSWSERRDAASEKAATEAGEVRARSRLNLTAAPADGGERLSVAANGHELSELTVAFPRALGVTPQHPATPGVEAGWFRGPLLRLTDGGPDAREGVLPVLVTARYWDGDAARTAAAVYDVAWTTQGHWLRGRTLRLTAMRLRDRRGTAAALEQAWARSKP